MSSRIEGYLKPDSPETALKFMFDHHARFFVASGGKSSIDFGEFWIELHEPTIEHIMRAADSAYQTIYVLCDHGCLPDECPDCENEADDHADSTDSESVAGEPGSPGTGNQERQEGD
jgi:hypothetical protein